MDWMDTLKQIAPTVATALGGPLAGAAVTAIGSIFGMSESSTESIGKMFADGKLTADHLAEIRKLELEYQNNEKERGFKYSELVFKDRDSARQMNISTKSLTPSVLTWIVVTITLVCEGALLFNQMPSGTDPIILGRVLGTMDSALIMVLGFWFGSSHGSQSKDHLIATK